MNESPAHSIEPAAAATEAPATGRLVAPIAPDRRVPTIDILRGFAIFGILLVNMALFNQSVYHMVIGPPAGEAPLDSLARWFIAFFAEGKFYSIFSFLFGLGMALQAERAHRRGARFGRFWFRRMLVLFGFGLVHAYLFWPGDILLLYSLLGLVLLLFYQRQPRTLLIWFVLLLAVPALLNAALSGLVLLANVDPVARQAVAAEMAKQLDGMRATAAQADAAYAGGSFAAATAQRVRDMNFTFTILPFMAFNVLAMMVLGLYAGRRSRFADIPAHLPWFRRVALWGFIVGVTGNFLFVYFGEMGSRMIPTPAVLVSTLGQIIGAPALSLCYIASLTLLAQRAGWARRLAPLANVGRMALTNYLLQTLLCTTIFFGYGLGFYGRAAAASGLALTVVIYLLEMAFSAWWLARFRFGPMEWLWRSLTYGRRQPMRLAGGEGGAPHEQPA